MWKWKLLKQTGVCMIIALTFLLARNADIPQMNKGSEAVIAYLSKNYSVQDVMTFTKKNAMAVVRAPVTMTNAVLSANEKESYGDPLNETGNGDTASVYAIGGGTVTEVGENEKIGKFVKITHGDDAESVYGNCKKIYVTALERVKKGQIIATFKKENDREFYYSFSNLN